MGPGLEERIGRVLVAWQRVVRRRARTVAALSLGSVLPLGLYVVTALGVNADNLKLISPDLPFMRNAAAFQEHFPSLDDSLLVVVDGRTPELAREATTALARRLSLRRDAFHDVYVPGGGEFFERHGLLYREVDDLYEFGDYLALYQPLLAELARDPSVATLADMIEVGLSRVNDDGDEVMSGTWPGVLDRISHATVAVYQDYPIFLSWESLLLEGSALDPTTRGVIVAEPILDFDALLAAGPALAAVREAAAELELDAERGVRVRVTGNPALNYDEMLGLLRDVGLAGIASFALVTIVLMRALHSGRLVGAAALTLLVGLVWTAAFAAATVGSLNLVSIAFGVLFIGLGVDFGIHLGMHYADARRGGYRHTEAMERAIGQVGSSLLICAVSTAIGFFAFVPTDYRGVAELGLIAGVGMFVILFLTVTLFPALLASWLAVEDAVFAEASPGFSRARALHAAEGNPRVVCAIAAALAVGALFALPHLRFDPDVVRMRNPYTESVQAFDSLLADAETTPWYADAMAGDLAAAQELAAGLEALPVVDRAVTLASYVPENQEEKLEILADLALLLDFPSVGREHPDVPVEEQIEALRSLHEFLAGSAVVSDGQSKLASSGRLLRDRLAGFLERLESAVHPEDEIASFEEILLGHLPDQLERLRRALRADPISLESLPDDLVKRMRSDDGVSRVQIFPREDLAQTREMAAFADAVRAVAPRATGLPVNLIEFGRATADSLRQALATALAVIALLLAVLWRRLEPAVLALAPLVLATLLTSAAMVLGDIAFNFANVIVLPLLLGVGIDSGIHLVQRSRRGIAASESVAGSTTGRAVFYSALTTIASFGSLALSAHRGLATLGLLLVIALLLGLACNLLVLPALLSLRRRGGSAG